MALPALFLASMLGGILLVASNPAVYPVSGIFASQTTGTNATFSLFQDLQTFMGASATCQTANETYLASIVSAEEMQAVSNLAVQFWKSDVASTYSSAPRSPAASPGKPGSVGWMNQSLFQGCVWIGMSNINHPGHVTYLSNINATTSLGFQDSAEMSDYIINMRSGSLQSPVQLSGWSLYGATPPVTSVGSGVDKHATCAMLCPQPSTLQQGLGYTSIVLASCTNIALPYICKKSSPLSLTPSSPVVERRRSRSLRSSAPAATEGSSSSTESAAETVTYTQVLGLADAEHSSWPIVGDPVNTSLPDGTGKNQAKCYPGGLYDYCIFPETIKRTQADWMFLCWDAGLEPLAINNYAALVTLLTMVPSAAGWPGSIQFVHTQSFLSSNSPEPVNLYSTTEFLRHYMFATEPLPSPNLPLRNLNIPLYNSTGLGKQPQPGWPYINTPNSTCGPDGFGFGCSIALVFNNNKTVGLTTVSANLLASGMCQRLSVMPSPRPSTAAVPVVKLAIMFEFEDGNATSGRVTGEEYASFKEEFLTKLSKEAVPAALPGVSAADVQIPAGPVTTFLVIPEDVTPGPQAVEMFVGVMLFITLPYTVNTTALINAYLTNIVNNPVSVLPHSFVEEYHIGPNTTSLVSSISGNLDGISDDSSSNLGVVIGVSIGVGLPIFALLSYGIYKFFQDANKSSGKKEKYDKHDV